MRLGVIDRIRTGDARVTTWSLRPLGDDHPQAHLGKEMKLAPPAGSDPATPGSFWRPLTVRYPCLLAMSLRDE